MSNPIANPWAALQNKWIAQESSRMAEMAALRRKVAAAEGMAAALARCAKIPVCVYPEGLYIDIEDHAAVIAAITAWKEASK